MRGDISRKHEVRVEKGTARLQPYSMASHSNPKKILMGRRDREDPKSLLWHENFTNPSQLGGPGLFSKSKNHIRLERKALFCGGEERTANRADQETGKEGIRTRADCGRVSGGDAVWERRPG